jgi:spore maturation protein SpmA
VNGIFVFLVVGSVLAAALGGRMAGVSTAALDAAKGAGELALGLVGQMALWLGFMRVLRDGGLLRGIARAIAPVMRRLFPDVPAEHPAMGAMVMNLAANVLGLGNAATPFGLKAMRELDRLNPNPGVATNSMALFLAINTAGVAVLPLGVIAVRASLGSSNAGGVIAPTLLATACGTLSAIVAAKLLERRPRYAPERFRVEAPGAAAPASLADGIAGIGDAETSAEAAPPPAPWSAALLGGFALVIALAIWRFGAQAPADATTWSLARDVLSTWLLPVLMAAIALFGLGRRVRVYESFVRGAREGFDIAVAIIPFLVAILVAIAMFRGSGLFDLVVRAVEPLTGLVGFPAEALPMALIRPLSGSGALGVMTETMKTYGPDSFVGFLVSVINGGVETTFYVLAVYFGSVGVRATRHTLAACLTADFVGVAAAYAFSRLFW